MDMGRDGHEGGKLEGGLLGGKSRRGGHGPVEGQGGLSLLLGGKVWRERAVLDLGLGVGQRQAAYEGVSGGVAVTVAVAGGARGLAQERVGGDARQGLLGAAARRYRRRRQEGGRAARVMRSQGEVSQRGREGDRRRRRKSEALVVFGLRGRRPLSSLLFFLVSPYFLFFLTSV